MSYYENPSNLYEKSSGFGFPESSLPKLRSDLIVRRLQYSADQIFYVIKDPVSREYLKYPPPTWDLMALFDGEHTDEQIISEYNEKYPFGTIDEEFLEACKDELKSSGLLDVSSTEKNLMLMDRIRSQRKHRIEKKNKWTFEYMTIFSFDPDEFMGRIIPYLRFLYTPAFFVISTIGILLMLVINIIKWDEFVQATIQIYTFQDKTLWDVIVFFLLFTISLGLHELAHALTLKHYGGECHEMGFLLFYGSPAFFVDSTEAYLFEKRSQRIWFSLAGCYSEMIVCSIASYIWFFTLPGTTIHDLAFTVFVFFGISGLLMNLNPLVKLDGYFILEDLVGIEGLREESFNFIGWWIKKNILRLEAEPPAELTRRKRRIFVTFGFFSILYTASLYALIVFWIRNIYLETFGQLGSVLFLLTLYLLFRKKLRAIFNFLKFFYLDKKEVLMRRKPALVLGSIVLAVLLLIPISHIKISGEFVLGPVERAEIRSPSDGFVDEVLVKENDSTARGQVLARVRNPNVSENIRRIGSRLNILDREISMTASQFEGSENQMKVREREQLLHEKKEAEREVERLVLKTPIQGTIVTPRLEDRVGSFAKKGSLFCVVANIDQVRVQIPVREYDIDDVEVGQKVLLKVIAYPSETFEGQVEKISPASAERVEALEGTFTNFTVDVVIDNKHKKLVSGMSGYAKILAGRHSIVRRIVRELNRGVQSIIW